MFEHLIETSEQLRELVPAKARNRLSGNKELTRLDAHARAWIEASPFVLLATADHAGRCDVSPRGGPPGWVRVLDEGRLALPDAPGNRRLDSAHNVLENGRCGLIFLVPGRTETLRVNGRACLTRDPEALEGIPGDPKLAFGVLAEEVYLHCSKAFMRAQLWEPGSWPDPDALPTGAEIFRDHVAGNGVAVERAEAEAAIEESIRERMW
jgi:PPOX class probable FMN-dependent enzyme